MQGPKLEPLIFAIFGASGDLARRKLIPAMFDLFKRGYLPDQFALLGISRSKLSDADFRDQVFCSSEFVELASESEQAKQEFAQRLFYQPIDTNQQDDYGQVKERLETIDSQFQTRGNVIFYLSTPPSLYEKIPAYLSHYRS